MRHINGIISSRLKEILLAQRQLGAVWIKHGKGKLDTFNQNTSFINS